MSAPDAPRRVVDLDALAGAIADSLQEPTYCLDFPGVSPDAGFVRFTVSDPVGDLADMDVVTYRATVSLVSDGEDEVEGAAGEVVELVVRRVTR